MSAPIQAVEITGPSRADGRRRPSWTQKLGTPAGPRAGEATPFVRGAEALLRVRDVASMLSLSTATVYGLCDRGELAYVSVGGTIRVRREDLDCFIRGRS